jgi:hypothetical protein
MQTIHEEFHERIINSIELHKKAINSEKMVTICLPDAQKLLIRKALQYYKSQYEHFNSVPTDTENYEIFDLMTLQALFNYQIDVKLTKEEEQEFTGYNGIDLPIYHK